MTQTSIYQPEYQTLKLRKESLILRLSVYLSTCQMSSKRKRNEARKAKKEGMRESEN